MSNISYPSALKNLLKCGPVCVVFMGFGIAFPTVLYDTLYHTQEHIPKYYFRSCKFDRIMRRRDDKLRYYYKPMIDFDPNDQNLTKLRPIQRY